MKRSSTVVVGLFLGSVILSACGSSGPDYDQMCVDKATGVRLPDGVCDNDDDHSYPRHSWIYYPHGQYHPAVGRPLAGGSYARPSGRGVSVPAAGGFGGGGGGTAGG